MKITNLLLFILVSLPVYSQLKRVSLVEIPFFYNGRYLGEIPVKIVNNRRISKIEKNKFQAYIQDIISAESLEEIKKQTNKENWIDIKFLREKNITVDFDYSNLRIILDFPIKLLKTSEQSLSGAFIPPWANAPLKPSKYSGFINYNAYKIMTSKSEEPSEFNIDFDSNFNFYKIAFENEVDFKSNKQ